MAFIYFFLSLETSPQSGVLKKIFSQIMALKKEGIDARLILVQIYPLDYNHNSWSKVYFLSKNREQTFLHNLLILYKARKIFSDTLKILEDNDIFYFRGYGIPIVLYPLNFMTGNYKGHFISEHQTMESSEFKLTRQYRAYFTEFLFGKVLRKRIDGFVGVTDEIGKYQIKKSGDPKKPHITIGNGIDVNSVPLRQISEINTQEINLLCTANVNRWHGLDRLINGIALYKGSISITSHIAGDGPELINLKKLTKTLGLSNKIIFHGFQSGSDLDNLFNQCHIAIGSLGIHRKGLNQTSELKAREYCARGIPYTIACSDPDFPDDYPYILRIPSDESPVDIEQLIQFAQNVYRDLDHPRKMRAFASEHLDWSVKMNELKTFLENFIKIRNH
jgi:glycosyltransferase involved in cell wall biosynthesis